MGPNEKNAVTSITESIKERKRQKGRKLLYIYLWRFFVVILILLFTYGMHLIDISAFTRVNSIIVSGNRALSATTVQSHSRIVEGERVWLISNLWSSNFKGQSPLYKTIKVSKVKNHVLIAIEEHRILGKVSGSDHVLLQSGQLVPMAGLDLSLRANIKITGFSEESLALNLAKSFEKVEDGVMMYISEIHQVSVSYDDAMVMLLLDDGNRIYTDFAGIELMNEYRLILNHLKPENKCIWLDALTRAASSVPCEDDN